MGNHDSQDSNLIRQKFLDGINIRTPCPQDWDSMQGDDKSRYCEVCNKNVFNLFAMTQDEACDVVANGTGGLCLRLTKTKDGTLVTQSNTHLLKRKFSFFTKLAAAIAAGLSVIGLTATAQAQSSESDEHRNSGFICDPRSSPGFLKSAADAFAERLKEWDEVSAKLVDQWTQSNNWLTCGYGSGEGVEITNGGSVAMVNYGPELEIEGQNELDTTPPFEPEVYRAFSNREFVDAAKASCEIVDQSWRVPVFAGQLNLRTEPLKRKTRRKADHSNVIVGRNCLFCSDWDFRFDRHKSPATGDISNWHVRKYYFGNDLWRKPVGQFWVEVPVPLLCKTQTMPVGTEQWCCLEPLRLVPPESNGGWTVRSCF